MAHPVFEQLYLGPLDGARIVPTATDILVSYEIAWDNRPSYGFWFTNVVSHGRYTARYVFDGTRYVYNRDKGRKQKR